MTTLTRQLTRLIADKPIDDNGAITSNLAVTGDAVTRDLAVAELFLLDAAAYIIVGQNNVAGQKVTRMRN